MMFRARDLGDWGAAFRYIDEAAKYPECAYAVSQMTQYVVHPKSGAEVNLGFGCAVEPNTYKVNEDPLLVNIGGYAKFLAKNWVLRERLPLLTHSVDSVAIDVRRAAIGIEEACRILKPEGRLYCTVKLHLDGFSERCLASDLYMYVKHAHPRIVDVIIPSRTSTEYKDMVTNCVDTLRRSERNFKFNVVLIESEHEEPQHVGQDQTIQWTDREFSYNAALNLGISVTRSDWVVLSNNDVLFHPGWFTEISRLHRLHPEIKSFSCWNGYGDWHPKRFPHVRGDFIVDDRITFGMSGWLIVVKRDLLAQMVLSDRVRLWYSDNIYVDELKRLGALHALACRAHVDHLESQTLDKRTYNSAEDLGRYLDRGLAGTPT